MEIAGKEEILTAIAGVSNAVVQLSIDMNRRFEESEKRHQEMLDKLKVEMNQRFEENDKQHEEMMTEMNRKFEERDKHHEEMLDKLKADIDKRFDQNDEAHRYLQLAIDTLGILSKENDIDHAEYNQKLNIKRIKFSSQ